ncbi:DUF3089 domain-containing protein [Novosphingobium sp. G106]|uniref:DUF3089 domain-containing protein n=1 Tax=Novosphingobium sp. G106 TaxID=2849500 RepID=UPI001C2DB2CD|nr:DUF3089 domain-containing protein [Novosphingobium sp. G106]MBV1691141.1 DUF3089 domain-containing protein [Novosphingobium sp. G106]
MVRKFLYIMAVLVVLLLAGAVALVLWSDSLTKIAFVPTAKFTPQRALAANVYDDPAMWIARPGLGAKDPSHWLPPGFKPEATTLPAAVFFIHPTSYLEKAQWNAPLDDAKSRDLAETFVRGMASAFNASPDLWAPRYRQAAFGAFLTDEPQANEAIDAAYADVLLAFDAFVAGTAKDQPIVLAGHSQGALHLKRLLRDRVAGTPLAKRIAAVYAIGWPISLGHDLQMMGLPACARDDQPGCVVSWLSFAEPADNHMLLESYAARPGLDGKPVGGSAFLCTNPLTGAAGGQAEAKANLGTLVPDLEKKTGALIPAMVPARCGPDGFLYIGDPPKMGPYVGPGNNYHVYDIPLFWANLRADVAKRVAAWQANQQH